jgi:hypothetical protein
MKKLRICDPAIQTIIWTYWRNQLKTNKVDSGETFSLNSLDSTGLSPGRLTLAIGLIHLHLSWFIYCTNQENSPYVILALLGGL